MAAPRPARAKRAKFPNAGYLQKTPSEVHEGFAAYIAETTGREVDAQTVSVVQRLYPLYLKSPAVVKAREEAKAAKEAEEARKKAEKAKRLKERLAKVEEQRKALLAELGDEFDGEDFGDEEPGAEVVPIAKTKRVTVGDFITRKPEPEPEPEVEETEDEDDEEPEADEVDLTLETDDDDLWDDDEEAEEDF